MKLSICRIYVLTSGQDYLAELYPYRPEVPQNLRHDNGDDLLRWGERLANMSYFQT